jgi:hypothetical protein
MLSIYEFTKQFPLKLQKPTTIATIFESNAYNQQGPKYTTTLSTRFFSYIHHKTIFVVTTFQASFLPLTAAQLTGSAEEDQHRQLSLSRGTPHWPNTLSHFPLHSPAR